MKKTILFLAVFIVLSVFIVGCGPKTDEPKLIGGDKDSHGCLIGAGYSWCDAKQKCIRQWEEPCKTADELSACISDSDCIPLPNECHPMECVNKKFEGNYVKPEMCTMMFAVEAAYTAEDCACVDKKCINKNRGKSAEVPQGKIAAGAVIDSYASCVAAGGAIMESYPMQCKYENQTFVGRVIQE